MEKQELTENDECQKKQWRIHTFVIRAGHMTDSEKQNYKNLSEKWCVPFEEKELNYEEIFGNKNPVTIEIGFGMGQATAIIAEQNPNMNYLGLEVHKPGIGRLLGEIENRNLKNIRIIEHDAIEVLEKMIHDSSVHAFHVFFPDPWPKQKHHKRRLVQRPRTDLFARKVEKEGYVYMATDWLPYAKFALGELQATDGLVNKYSGFAPHQEWRPETRFEEKGVDANRVISELFFVRNDVPSDKLVPVPQKSWDEE